MHVIKLIILNMYYRKQKWLFCEVIKPIWMTQYYKNMISHKISISNKINNDKHVYQISFCKIKESKHEK